MHIQRLVRDSRRSRGAAKDPALADICRDSNALYTRDVTAKRSLPVQRQGITGSGCRDIAGDVTPCVEGDGVIIPRQRNSGSPEPIIMPLFVRVCPLVPNRIPVLPVIEPSLEIVTVPDALISIP